MTNHINTFASFLRSLFRKRKALTMADLYPVNLLAYTIAKNIPKCSNEAHLHATALLIQSHLIARYPSAVAQKYITQLKWELLFRKIELGISTQVTNS